MDNRGRLGLREAKKREVRRTIVTAAVALFEERGFEGTTMEEIAAAANVSRPTVFNYFSQKEAILPIAWNQLALDRLGPQLEAGVAGDADRPLELLRRFLVGLGDAFAEHPETARAFFVHHVQAGSLRRRAHGLRGRERDRPIDPPDSPDAPEAADSPEPPGEGRELKMRIDRYLTTLLAQAQQRGHVRRDYDPTELLGLLLPGLFASTIGPWLWGRRGDQALAVVIARHLDFFLHGLCGEPLEGPTQAI